MRNWTKIKDYTDILLFSIRFDEANMTDILLTNIYFTHLTAPGDTEAPVFAEGESGAKFVDRRRSPFSCLPMMPPAVTSTTE